MNFKDFSQNVLENFNQHMYNLIEPCQNEVEEAMLYSLKAGGKRIRPLLILATVKAFGKDEVTAYDAATAIEWVHTYSLIHDDLPAIDNDDLRRGKPTNHKVFGESTAILAGDALLTHSFDVLSASSTLESEKKVLLIQRLAEYAGSRGMIGGQLEDIQSENKSISMDTLQSIHERKTGALIQFSLFAGGTIAGQKQEVLDYLNQIAKLIGLAFQIRDDILDVVGDAESLGKNVGQDEKLDKSTYPSLLGLEGSYDKLEEMLSLAEESNNKLADVLKKENNEYDKEILDSFIDTLRLEKR
ncbi:MAG: polyprenyl synthetase family protein [Atopococcus tabaci]|uniref:Farnesyl diphosphate synthase n=1 Tax=Atopococcus tabaci TaxID=269774 RepID=A0AA43RK38_9LACT|nr:polyprenyl synthetase family protein [Atopococcus tabaci]